MTQSGGASVGGASFGIGIDLAQWERDLEKAEQIARARAQRIQGVLGAIPIVQGGQPVAAAAGTNGAAARATAQRVAAAPAQQGQNVPPWVQQVYDGGIAQGMSDADVRASLVRSGVPASQLPRAPSGAPSFARGGAVQAARAMQQTRQRTASLPGRSFGGTPTGGGSAGGGALGFLGLSGGQGILRTISAFAGIGLGLNVAALAASRLHDALVDSAGAAILLEQSSRRVGVAFGAGAGQFTGAGATAFAANPSTKGTQQEYQGAVASLGPLASQYGLTTAQVQALVTAEGQLARIHGVELPQAGQILETVLRGNVDAGQALGMQLTDQNGRLKSVGLSFDELVQSVGHARAEEELIKAVLAESTRQLTNAAAQGNDTVTALDRVGKAWDGLRTNLAKGMVGPVTLVVQTIAEGMAGAAGALEGPPVPTNYRVGPAAPARRPVPPAFSPTGLPGGFAPFTAPGLLAGGFPGLPRDHATHEDAGGISAVEQRLRITAAAEFQAGRAGIQARQAQAQLDTLGAQSDVRRLGVQQDINDLAAKRIDIESRLMNPLLEQQRVQDRITIATRENLNLTEATLKAQIAAVPSSNAAFALSSQQQRVRLQAQVQFSRALRGLAPAAGIAGIPELFGQARDLALAAPEVNLAAFNAQNSADVAARAQAQAGTSRQLASIPDQRRQQQLQDTLIPLGQARTAAQAAADAIARSLQGADLLSGPDRIKAEQDLADARLKQADAAAKIAGAQAEAGNINPTVNLNVVGLTDVQAATAAILDSLRPVIEASIRAAASQNRPVPGRVGNLP